MKQNSNSTVFFKIVVYQILPIKKRLKMTLIKMADFIQRQRQSKTITLMKKTPKLNLKSQVLVRNLQKIIFSRVINGRCLSLVFQRLKQKITKQSMKIQDFLWPCGPGWGPVRVGARSGLGPIWAHRALMGPYGIDFA